MPSRSSSRPVTAATSETPSVVVVARLQPASVAPSRGASPPAARGWLWQRAPTSRCKRPLARSHVLARLGTDMRWRRARPWIGGGRRRNRAVRLRADRCRRPHCDGHGLRAYRRRTGRDLRGGRRHRRHGTANIARTVLPVFRRQRHGVFVIVNSLVGEIAAPLMGSYAAGKWAQFGLARVLQLETRDAPGVDVCDRVAGRHEHANLRAGRELHGPGHRPPPPVYSPDAVAAAVVQCRTVRAATDRSASSTPSSSPAFVCCPRSTTG